MPCGTGKTLVCHWISAKLLYNRRICIVVPSLYLLSQTYSVWVEMKECNYLLVGSDAEIKTCDDTGLLLTTNYDDIEKYLEKHKNSDTIIISTYQSSEVLSKACTNLNYELDMIIFDEAHRTVGVSDRQFSCLLSDDNIKTKKRLFTTATEKIYHGDNDDVLSMNDTKIYGDVIYSYSFKQAIDNKQLCDYQIITPLINDESFWHIVEKNKYVIDKSISEDPIESRCYMTSYLLCQNIKEKGLKHILTFNNTNANAKRTHEVLRNMIKVMNIDCECYYLTGESSMKKRQKVIDSFTKDKCAIISSARIFQEGVDIPIVDCVCFGDNKLSVIDIIQSIGRVLRIYEGKEIGYILVPTLVNIEMNDENLFDVNPKDFGTVKNILKALGTVDDRIIDEFITKNYGHHTGNSKFILDTKNVELVSDVTMSIDDLNGKIRTIMCDRWGTVNWYQTLNEVKKYIDKNKIKPSRNSPDVYIRHLGSWIQDQQRNYKKRLQIMSNEHIRTVWETFGHDYSKYIKSINDKWYYDFEKLKRYIVKYHKCPCSSRGTTENKKIGQWTRDQVEMYKNKKGRMRNDKIYAVWDLYMSENKQYFMTTTEKWKMNLSNLKKYIDENKKRPFESKSNKNIEIRKLGAWIGSQKICYEKRSGVMKSQDICNLWTQFLIDYKCYIMSPVDKWLDTLEKVKQYINDNKKLPSDKNQDANIKYIGNWLCHTRRDYKNKINTLKNKVVYDKCTEFFREYVTYFPKMKV